MVSSGEMMIEIIECYQPCGKEEQEDGARCRERSEDTCIVAFLRSLLKALIETAFQAPQPGFVPQVGTTSHFIANRPHSAHLANLEESQT
jgi:hypothetical protein